MPNRTLYRGLSIAHFVVAAPLVLLSTFCGIILAPILVAGPVWLCILGAQLWNCADPRVFLRLRITHGIALFFAAFFCVTGWGMLHAHSDGLLSVWGIIPLTIGGLVGILAVLTLLLVRPAPAAIPGV